MKYLGCKCCGFLAMIGNGDDPAALTCPQCSVVDAAGGACVYANTKGVMVEVPLKVFIRAIDPVPVVLHCPKCYRQHVDEVDPVGNPGWENPPHTSHKCLYCSTVWRPADFPTEGVRSIETKGKSDTWVAGDVDK